MARGERLNALVKGDCDLCYCSTGKMDSEYALTLLQGAGREATPGGVRTTESGAPQVPTTNNLHP